MGQFIYFFPGATALGSIDDVRDAAGLGNVLVGPLQHNSLTGAGPSGERGLLVRRELNDAPAIGYRKESQTWIKCADGAFWLGWEGPLPGPDDLKRDDAPDCLWGVRLADGNQWSVPTARLHGRKGGTLIPQRISLDSSGKRLMVPVEKFKTLMDYATQAMIEFDRAAEAGENRVGFPEDFAFDACVECLATVYRVSKWEVGAMQILATDNMAEILGALVDHPTRMHMERSAIEAAKKNDHATTGGT